MLWRHRVIGVRPAATVNQPTVVISACLSLSFVFSLSLFFFLILPILRALGMSGETDCSKRRYNADSSTFHKRLRVTSHATTLLSNPDKVSRAPSRRRVFDSDGDGDNKNSDSESSSDSNTHNSSSTDDLWDRPPSIIEKEEARNAMQRKKQHRKSDRQRRAKIKHGMEQLKALVLLHNKLESLDRASVVSASVQLVQALRQELLELKAEVERTRRENAAMKLIDSAEFARLHAVMCSQLAAMSRSPLGQLTLAQLSSLQGLNSHYSLPNQQQAKNNNVSQQQLSGLNPLVSTNMLSSFGLPASSQAATQHQLACNQAHDRPLQQQQGIKASTHVHY